jgi:hypothetical protein
LLINVISPFVFVVVDDVAGMTKVAKKTTPNYGGCIFRHGGSEVVQNFILLCGFCGEDV